MKTDEEEKKLLTDFLFVAFVLIFFLQLFLPCYLVARNFVVPEETRDLIHLHVLHQGLYRKYLFFLCFSLTTQREPWLWTFYQRSPKQIIFLKSFCFHIFSDFSSFCSMAEAMPLIIYPIIFSNTHYVMIRTKRNSFSRCLMCRLFEIFSHVIVI